MKTIEIIAPKKKHKKIVKAFICEVDHFFKERDDCLIMRMQNKDVKRVREYLEIYGYKVRVYPYPLAKKGLYAEDKEGVVYENFTYFKTLFALNTLYAVTTKKKKHLMFIERYNHTFLNQLGYEWNQEVDINIQLAWMRSKTMSKYWPLIPTERLILQISRLCMILSIKLNNLVDKPTSQGI